MADKLPDASERAERYGIDRRALLTFQFPRLRKYYYIPRRRPRIRSSGIYGCPERLWAPW